MCALDVYLQSFQHAGFWAFEPAFLLCDTTIRLFLNSLNSNNLSICSLGVETAKSWHSKDQVESYFAQTWRRCLRQRQDQRVDEPPACNWGRGPCRKDCKIPPRMGDESFVCEDNRGFMGCCRLGYKQRVVSSCNCF